MAINCQDNTMAMTGRRAGMVNKNIQLFSGICQNKTRAISTSVYKTMLEPI